MGFKMKGSPAKLGSIQGTTGHRSALKMAEEAQGSPTPFVGALVGGLAKKAAGSLVKKGAAAVGKKIASSKIGKKVASSKIGKALGIGGGQQPEGPESPAKLHVEGHVDVHRGGGGLKKQSIEELAKQQAKRRAKRAVKAVEGKRKTAPPRRGGGLKKQSIEELANQKKARSIKRNMKSIKKIERKPIPEKYQKKYKKICKKTNDLVQKR